MAGATLPPRAYPACLLRSHAPRFVGDERGRGAPRPPRASPCVLATLVRVPLTLERRGRMVVCVAGFLPTQE